MEHVEPFAQTNLLAVQETLALAQVTVYVVVHSTLLNDHALPLVLVLLHTVDWQYVVSMSQEFVVPV